jgi:hypothetical protein
MIANFETYCISPPATKPLFTLLHPSEDIQHQGQLDRITSMQADDQDLVSSHPAAVRDTWGNEVLDHLDMISMICCGLLGKLLTELVLDPPLEVHP